MEPKAQLVREQSLAYVSASTQGPEAALQPMYGPAYEVHELAKARSSLGGGTSVFALKKDKGATSAHHPRITHKDSGE